MSIGAAISVKHWFGKNWVNLVILTILASLVFFVKINMPITDGDTGYYAVIARNIVQTGEWQSLHYLGNDIPDKPPLSIWPMAILYKLFGFSDWTTKLFNAVLAVLAILMIYLLAREFSSTRAAFWAGLIFLTSVLVFYEGQIPQQDIPIAFFTMLGFLGWLRFIRTRKALYFHLVWVAMGCNTLTRGLPGIAYIAGPIILYLILYRFFGLPKLTFFTKKYSYPGHILFGTMLFFFIGILWFVLEYLRRGPDFLYFFWGFGFTRILTTGTVNTPPKFDYWFEIPLLIGAFIPWSGFIWHALKRGWMNRREENGVYLFLLCWFIVTFGMALVVQWRVIRYVLPCLPPLAMLTGILVDDILVDKPGKLARQAFKTSAILNLIVVLPLFLGLIYSTYKTTGSQSQYLPLVIPFISLLLSGMFLFSVFALWKKFSWALIATSILTLFSIFVLLDTVDRHMDYINPWSEISTSIRRELQPGDRVVSMGTSLNTIIYYSLGVCPIHCDNLSALNEEVTHGSLQTAKRIFLVNSSTLGDISKSMNIPATVRTIKTAPLGQSAYLISFM